jgi:2-oxoglutarate ferredoxin oxidoreductase subunit alpha
VANGRCKTVPVHHVGGTVHNPEAILAKILEAVR